MMDRYEIEQAIKVKEGLKESVERVIRRGGYDSNELQTANNLIELRNHQISLLKAKLKIVSEIEKEQAHIDVIVSRIVNLDLVGDAELNELSTIDAHRVKIKQLKKELEDEG